MCQFDFIDHRVKFFARRAEDMIILIHTGNAAVGWHFDNAEAVNRAEFFGLGDGRPRHAGELIIQAEIVLIGDRGKGDVFRLDRQALFGLNRLMQAIREAPARHHAAREFVDQDNLTIAHDVFFVFGKEFMRAQTLVDVMDDRRAFGIIKRLLWAQKLKLLQPLLEEFVTLIGKGHTARFFIDGEMLICQFGDDFVDGHIEIRAILRWARNNKRRARLVDQD